MTVQEGPGGVKTKIIRHNYPIEEGLTAGTTRQTGDPFLRAEEGSIVTEKEKVGL